MSRAIDVIRDEHRSMASVLKALQSQLAAVRAGTAEPDWPLYEAMLDYLQAFPEVMHHPKEDQFLFAALRGRHAPASAVIEALEGEHAQSAADLKQLVSLVRGARSGGSIEAFADALDRYAQFLWKHMETEEQVVIPMAREHLTNDDWAAIDAAFDANRQPRW